MDNQDFGQTPRRRSTRGADQGARQRSSSPEGYRRSESRPAPRSSSARQTPRPATKGSQHSMGARPQRVGADRSQRTGYQQGQPVRPAARRSDQLRSGQPTRRPSGASARRSSYAGRSDLQMHSYQKSPNKGANPIFAAVAGILVFALVAFALVKIDIPGKVVGFVQPQKSAEQVAAETEAAAKAEAERRAAIDAAATPVSFTMSFTGDCIIANGDNFAYERSLPEQYDLHGPGYFFENVKDIFAKDDYTVVDMECTLTHSTDRTYETFAFKADPEYVDILKLGNVQAGTLANNHTHDFGEQSYTDTWNTLEQAGIVPFGYDDIAYVDIKGVKVALIGIYELDEYLGIMDNMLENIKKAKDNGATVTIVFQHWGEEKMYVPDTDQVTLGHAAIDAGADLVVGCHPHRVQGIEKYNGRYIAYSMGNFCFGGNMAPADMDCYIFQQTFTVRGKTVELNDDINVIPCSISSVDGYNNYQPTPATGEEAERILGKIEEISQEIPQI